MFSDWEWCCCRCCTRNMLHGLGTTVCSVRQHHEIEKPNWWQMINQKSRAGFVGFWAFRFWFNESNRGFPFNKFLVFVLNAVLESAMGTPSIRWWRQSKHSKTFNSPTLNEENGFDSISSRAWESLTQKNKHESAKRFQMSFNSTLKNPKAPSALSTEHYAKWNEYVQWNTQRRKHTQTHTCCPIETKTL